MPRLTRWYIKSAFAYFILALLVGVALGVMVNRPLNPLPTDLLPPYFHLLSEGWITMLIIGVAFWMFPKFSLERPRGSETLGWASYVLLNLGLIGRVVSEPVNSSLATPNSIWSILLIIAAALQWLGGMAFVINTWPRIKEK